MIIKKIVASCELWLADRNVGDALSGLAAVAECVNLDAFDVSVDGEGEACPIDQRGARLCPAAALVKGVWDAIGHDPDGARLYEGAALGLAALAGAMVGAPFYRFLPYSSESLGLDSRLAGGGEEYEIWIAGLKGKEGLKVREGGFFAIPADAYSAIWRCSEFYIDDNRALENYCRLRAEKAGAALRAFAGLPDRDGD